MSDPEKIGKAAIELTEAAVNSDVNQWLIGGLILIIAVMFGYIIKILSSKYENEIKRVYRNMDNLKDRVENLEEKVEGLNLNGIVSEIDNLKGGIDEISSDLKQMNQNFTNFLMDQNKKS